MADLTEKITHRYRAELSGKVQPGMHVSIDEYCGRTCSIKPQSAAMQNIPCLHAGINPKKSLHTFQETPIPFTYSIGGSIVPFLRYEKSRFLRGAYSSQCSPGGPLGGKPSIESGRVSGFRVWLLMVQGLVNQVPPHHRA